MEDSNIKKDEKKKFNYKLLIIIPVLMIIICSVYLVWSAGTNNIKLDIDLKGGTQLMVESSSPIDSAKMEGILSKYDANIRIARGVSTYSMIISFDSATNTTDVISTLKENGYDFKNYSEQTIGPVLGASFFNQAIIALLIAFALIAVAIFAVFKIPIVSLYAAACPAFDIIELLAISQMLGVKLSLVVFATLLMLIGESVSDDVMVASRVLKEGEFGITERFKGGFKTSLTSTMAMIVATAAMFMISVSSVISQIAFILFIGLMLDFMNTWLFNATLLRMYVEKKERVKQ